jgi:hypothetical protein
MPIANPFSRFLRERLTAQRPADSSANDDLRPAIDAFVRFWDEVETLVIQVYKSGRARRRDMSDWRDARATFPERYAPVEAALEPCWQGTKAAGKPVSGDPFRTLIAPESARELVDNWSAMQHLPAAREALNQLLLNLGAPE